jgi:hypothetical protein
MLKSFGDLELYSSQLIVSVYEKVNEYFQL